MSNYNVFEKELSPDKVKEYGYNILDEHLKIGDIVFAYRDIKSDWLGWGDKDPKIVIAKYSIGIIKSIIQDGYRGLFDKQLEVYWWELFEEFDSLIAFQSFCFAVDVRKLNWKWQIKIAFEKFKKNPSEFLYNILTYRWS